MPTATATAAQLPPAEWSRPRRTNTPAFSYHATVPYPNDKRLTCLPSAVATAAAMHGVDIPSYTMVAVKSAIGEIVDGKTVRGTGTFVTPFFQEIARREQGWGIRFRRVYIGKGTLKEVVADMRKRGMEAGIVITKTPSHAWAIKVTKRDVAVVDNGAVRHKLQNWRGGNITWAWGIVPINPASEVEMKGTLKKVLPTPKPTPSPTPKPTPSPTPKPTPRSTRIPGDAIITRHPSAESRTTYRTGRRGRVMFAMVTGATVTDVMNVGGRLKDFARCVTAGYISVTLPSGEGWCAPEYDSP